MPLDNQQLISDLQDYRETIVRLSDPAVIDAFVESNPGAPVPSASRSEIAEETAQILTDYYGAASAASGAGLVPPLNSAKDAFRDAMLAIDSSGPLATRLLDLFAAADAWWSVVEFQTGFPVGDIVSDTEVSINLPDRAGLAATAATAFVNPVEVGEPGPGESPIEPAVRAAREAAEKECNEIWIAYAAQVTTTHSGITGGGSPSTVTDQPIS